MSPDSEKMVKKFGNWFMVVVNFYDFLHAKANPDLCIAHMKELDMKEIMDGFANGQDVFEKHRRSIERKWGSFREAWNDFVKENT